WSCVSRVCRDRPLFPVGRTQGASAGCLTVCSAVALSVPAFVSWQAWRSMAVETGNIRIMARPQRKFLGGSYGRALCIRIVVACHHQLGDLHHFRFQLCETADETRLALV